MSGRRYRKFEVTFSADTGRPEVTPVRTSRIKMMATMLAITLAIAPAPWAFKTYDSARGSNGTKPVGTHESVELLPGIATSTRNGQTQTAASDADGLSVDLGEVQSGSSQSFQDLIRIRNSGSVPLLVYVEPVGISETPLHASVSGDRAPGAYWVEPGETRPVDLGMAADLIAAPRDVAGELAIRTASGLVKLTVPAKVTLATPSQESVLAALLAAAGVSNPEAGGFGKLGDAAAGLEKPDFEVEGVWDGGLYTGVVKLAWKPVGPLVGARATLNGRPIGRAAVVDAEGDYLLRLEGSIMGSVPFEREIRFRIDRTAPDTALVAPAITFGNPASFSVRSTDASSITSVEVVLQRRAGKPEASPTPSPTPKPSSSPAPQPSSSPTPKPSSTPTPTPAPSSSANGSETTADRDAPEQIRVQAAYDADSGMWIARLQLEPGTYDVWAEAVDRADNRAVTDAQQVTVLAPLLTGLR